MATALPYIFATQNGPIPLSQLDADLAAAAAAAGSGMQSVSSAGVLPSNSDNSGALQAVLTAGKAWRVGDGAYSFSSGVIADYSSTTFPAPGVASARLRLLGDSRANTILNFAGTSGANAITMTGEVTAVYQGVNSLDEVGQLTISRTTNTGTGIGLKLIGKAYTTVSDMIIQNFAQGLWVDSSLSMSFSRLYLSGNVYGVVINHATPALLPNAISFTDCQIANNSSAGAIVNLSGATNSFSGGSVENNGVTGGSGGGILINVTADNGNCTLNIDDIYFEANGGYADLSIVNTSATRVVVNINRCTFNRVLSTRYVTSNLNLSNSGGGSMMVNLSGCGFLSGGSYSPNAGRPFMIYDSATIVNCGEGTIFSELTSLGTTGSTWPCAGWTSGGSVAADGSSLVAAPGVTYTKPGTGIYTITRSTGWGATSTSYVPMAICTDTGGGIKVERISVLSATAFQVVLTNNAGALANAQFAWTVTTLA